jgi:Tfp pilus assembly protein PilW
MIARGATLIELLVGLLLAGLVMAGTLGTLAQVQRVWRDADLRGRMHERAQYVFASLEPELQMAGYFGSGTPTRLSTASPGAVATAWGDRTVLPLQPAVRVLQEGWTLPCPLQGGGAKPGSDGLILRRASTRIAAPDGALQLLGSAMEPGLRDLIVRIFYVARAADGDSRTPALRVKSLSAIAGEPAFIDTEIMPGVDDFQVELLPDAVSPRSVRVQLRIRADAGDVPAGRDAPVLVLERRFTLRNAAS